MASRIISAHVTKKGTLKAIFKQDEIGKNIAEDVFNAELSKKTSQKIHRDLENAFDAFIPHLMFSTQLIDKSVAIPTNISDEDYFKKWHFEDDRRFDGIKITGIKTFGKHAVEGIYIYGHKKTEHGDIVELKSPLISFDHNPENKYPLHVLASSSYETLEDEINKYLFELKDEKTITNQLEMWPNKKEKVA